MSKGVISIVTSHLSSGHPIAKRHTSASAYHLVAVCLNVPLSLCSSFVIQLFCILFRIRSPFPSASSLQTISNHHHQCPDFMGDLHIHAAVQGKFLMEFECQRLHHLLNCSSHIHNKYLSIHLSLLIEIMVRKSNHFHLIEPYILWILT